MFQETKNKNNPNISTGFFGKLPGFNDFIKYNAAGKEILTIDNWIQEGLALAKLKYKNQWKNYYDNLSNVNFVYPFTGTDSTTIGVIAPGNDKSGRSFPFLMFSNIKKNIDDELSFYLLPYIFKDLFYSFDEIVEANKMIDDTTGLKSLIDNLKVSHVIYPLVINDYKKFISENRLSDFFSLGSENKFYLKEFFNNNLKIFEHFICFNYSTELYQPNNSFMICYCINLLQKIFKNSDSQPGIFWMQLDDKSWLLYLTFTKPTPKDFVDLLFYNRTLFMTSEENSTENKKNFYSGDSLIRDNSIINGNISLNEFLNSITNCII
jgi:type VI secretion system ImpM family protein